MAASVELLDWDTAFWGVRAARVHLSDAEDLPDATEKLQRLSVTWSSLLLPATRLDVVSAAVRAGYELVDTRYAMTATLDRTAAPCALSPAQATDHRHLLDLAATAFSGSRFFNDRHLDDVRCSDFYETWLRNSLTGDIADAVLVERDEGVPVGFICLRSDGVTGSISLIAVSAKHLGMGFGRRLVSQGLQWMSLQGLERAQVVTQLTNTAAIALYSRAGFEFVEAAHWMHGWHADAPGLARP